MTVKQVYQCHGHLKHEITSLRSTKLTSFFQLSTYPSHVINAIYVSCFVFVNLRDKKIVSISSFFPDSIKLHVIYVVLFVFILNPTPALMAFTEVTNVHVTSAQPTACRFQYSSGSLRQSSFLTVTLVYLGQFNFFFTFDSFNEALKLIRANSIKVHTLDSFYEAILISYAKKFTDPLLYFT